MPQFDFSSYASQIIWLAITFSLLYVVMARNVLPKVREVLQGRQERITGDLEKAGSIKEEAERAKMDYDSVLLNSRAKARQMIAEAEATVQKEITERNNKLDITLAQQMEEAEAQVINSREDAMQKLIPVSVDLACQIIGQFVGKDIDKARVEAVVKEQVEFQGFCQSSDAKDDLNETSTIRRAV